jgi:hypothetical protein
MARPATAAVRLLTGEREPVRTASVENIDIATGGLLAIDGIQTIAGDRVLLKDQDDAKENGIYEAQRGRWYRSSDARSSRAINKGVTVHVQSGSINAGRVYAFQTDDPNVDTDDILITFFISDDVGADLLEVADEAIEDMESAASGLLTDIAEAGVAAGAIAVEAAALAAGYASDAVSQGNVPIYATRAGIPGLEIPEGINAFRVNGYSAAGDGGNSLFMLVDSEPDIDARCKVQSADGRWWRLVVEAGAVRIEQVGGKADWNGAAGTDNTAAVDAIMSLSVWASAGGNDLTQIAPDILFGIGDYYFADTYECRIMARWKGVGSGFWTRNAGTNLVWPANTTNIIVQQINTAGADGGSISPNFLGTACGSIFDGLTFRCAGTQTDKTKHGLQMRTQATARNCYFYNHGGSSIYIVATAGSPTIEGNANGWVVENCYGELFGGNGLHVLGADVNAGKCNSWTTRGTAGLYGCGIYDRAVLGNHYTGIQITGYGNCGVHHEGMLYYLTDDTEGIGAATEPGTNDAIWFPHTAGAAIPGRFEDWSALGVYFLQIPVYSSGGSNVFEEVYVEGTGPVHVKAPGLVIGGQHGGTNRTANLSAALATTMSPLVVNTGVAGRRQFKEGTPAHDVNGDYIWVGIGTPVAADENLMNLMEHRREFDGALSWEWRYDGGDIRYGLRTQKDIWSYGGPHTERLMGRPLTPVPHVFTLGDFALRVGSSTTDIRRMGMATAIPTAAGEYARGEFRFNMNPTAGGTLGWSCVTGGCLAPAWVTATNYAVGAYIKASNNKFYICTVDGGTSSTDEPTHGTGVAAEGDGFSWRDRVMI